MVFSSAGFLLCMFIDLKAVYKHKHWSLSLSFSCSLVFYSLWTYLPINIVIRPKHCAAGCVLLHGRFVSFIERLVHASFHIWTRKSRDKINVSHQIEFWNNFEWAPPLPLSTDFRLFQPEYTFMEHEWMREGERETENEREEIALFWCLLLVDMCLSSPLLFSNSWTIQFDAFVSNSILRYYNKLTYCALFGFTINPKKRALR